MGEETVDEIIKRNPDIKPITTKLQTMTFNLIGSYSKQELVTGMVPSPEELKKQYIGHLTEHKGIPSDIAEHLYHSYGTAALRVVELGEESKKKGLKTGLNERIHPEYPFIASEIVNATRNEMAEKPNDIICRRVPIAFLDHAAAESLIPDIVSIMAREKNWSSTKVKEETEAAKTALAYLK